MSMERHPDAAVVDRLGGPTEVGLLCRVRPQAVSQWKRNGIPSARRDFLMLLRPAAFGTTSAPPVPTTQPEEARNAA